MITASYTMILKQNRYKRVPVLVRGGFHGSGKAGDANRLKLRDAAANALDHASCLMVPVYADPALNERCYGDLQVVLVSQTALAQKIIQKFRLF
mgnify:CR=1 FL=1